ncbi:MAG TPA: PAS domain-containing protein [Dissulfurispiraceae bacterium]|nr:PAS domain-containing protein [Dissulfurispiraceae bacterium]
MGIPSIDGLNRVLFNAIPAIALIVDHDVRIVDYNAAASKLFGDNPDLIINQRGGKAFDCIHSAEVEEGCGRAPHCRTCVIRNSVKEASAGRNIVRSRARLELVADNRLNEVFALISASPFEYDGRGLVLLVIEDISEIIELQRIIPICMTCKKIRNDDRYWTDVAAYFSKHLDVEFSHGYCPDCAEKEFAKLRGITEKL